MEEIIRLIEITKKKGQRSIQLVNQNFRKKEISKDNLLYESILNGSFTSDEEAAKLMFKADPGNRNYRNTKGKLKQKLLNHLYFLDYDKETYTVYQKRLYECCHILHQCRILMEEDAGDLAAKRLPQLIKTAREFEFTDVAVEAARLLRNECAKSGKSAFFADITRELTKLKQFRDAVEECENLYFEVIATINKSVSSRNKAINKIPSVIARIEQRAKELKSKRLDLAGKRLRLTYNSITGRFKDNILLCESLEHTYIKKSGKDIRLNISQHEIALTKMQSYFFVRDYENGEKYARQKLDVFKNKGADWFAFMEYYFLLAIGAGKYKKAEEIFRKIRTHKNFHQLPEEAVHRWNIYRAYLIFFSESKLLKWGFDIDQFIAQPPAFDKNRQGYNVAALLIQFMFLLREGMVYDVKSRIDALRKYSSVHLDKRHNYRNSIFIRMLEIVAEKEFNFELIREKGTTYYKKLKRFHIPFDLKNELEVIPYEKLWDHIIDILKTNKLYIHYRFYNPIE